MSTLRITMNSSTYYKGIYLHYAHLEDKDILEVGLTYNHTLEFIFSLRYR